MPAQRPSRTYAGIVFYIGNVGTLAEQPGVQMPDLDGIEQDAAQGQQHCQFPDSHIQEVMSKQELLTIYLVWVLI